MRYRARGLEDIAKHFDDMSTRARNRLQSCGGQRSKVALELKAEAATWEAAAAIIRSTTIGREE